MTAKAKGNIKEKVVETALKLAAKDGWGKTTLAGIARAAKIPLSTLHDHFEDKGDIIAALGRMIDKKVLERVSKPDPKTPAKERLFDVLMERYEALNECRPGVVAILESLTCDPKQAVILLPHICKSMNWMLEAAGLNTSGIAGAVRVAGLTGIYAKNLCVWQGDESPDLAKTMAALDKDLGRAEYLAGMAGL